MDFANLLLSFWINSADNPSDLLVD